MKNFIFINYDLIVDKIYYKDNYRYFFIGDNKIYIIECEYDEEYINNLFELSNYLYFQKVNVNTFLINNNKKCFSVKDKIKIILIKQNDLINIDLNYIKLFQNRKCFLKDYNIINEWTNEIDTIEKEIIEYNDEFLIIKKSLDYFIGLAENALELINEVKNDIISNNDSIGHLDIYDINNPFVFIKTNKMYDISNYIKYKFYKNEVNYDEIEFIINGNNIYENIFLFSCLLYPSDYFKYLKRILLNDLDEKILMKFVNNIEKYNILLQFCQNKMKNVKIVKLVNWINK